jgi:serine/threonine protein kinase
MSGGPSSTRVVGRYVIHDAIAAGGMATVHLGRLVGPVGFTRTVAIKRLHPQFACDPEFVAMFIDEARLAARIRHPNVVQTLDVVASGSELFLVMDYVQGEPLSRLRRFAAEHDLPVPLRVVASIFCGVLHGLHAAHEAKSDHGAPLDIVHRDVSPQNILVGTDGIARVIDFGVAKALGRSHTTRDGNLKGKLAYMAPEQLEGKVSRRTDVFAAAIVLWETLTERRLFGGQDEVEVVGKILERPMEPPSKYLRGADVGALGQAGLDRLDAVTLRGLARNPEDRFESARAMALALEDCLGLASPTEVGRWVEGTASGVLDERARRVAEIESQTSARVPQSVPQPSLRNGAEDARTIVTPAPLHTEQGTQASSVSLSSQTPARQPHSWTTTVVVAVVAVVVAIAAPFGLAALRNRASSSVSSSKAATSVAMEPSTKVPPIVALPTSVGASVSTPMPGPAAPAEAALASASAAIPTPSVPPPGAAVHPTPKKVGADCSTPYSIDGEGHKHFKEECFR